MRIVTAGDPFLDIDAYAGILAYARLLNWQGIPAQAVSSAPLNESIPPEVEKWSNDLVRSYKFNPEDEVTIIDLSDPQYVDKAVDAENIVEVIDHHVGFEQYWLQRIGAQAKIEFIGAACTLVFEAWRDAGLLEQIDRSSARLLMCAILDNTLNFKALLTTERDKSAYEALKAYASLPGNWPEQYFSLCEKHTLANFDEQVTRSIKELEFNGIKKLTSFGQLTVWDANKFIEAYRERIKRLLEARTPWFMNIIDLKNGQSHFLAEDTSIKRWLETLLEVKFNGDIAVAEQAWLRKEVIKQDLQLLSSEA